MRYMRYGYHATTTAPITVYLSLSTKTRTTKHTHEFNVKTKNMKIERYYALKEKKPEILRIYMQNKITYTQLCLNIKPYLFPTLLFVRLSKTNM